MLVADDVNPMRLVLRQIQRVITFAAYCVFRGMSTPAYRPKSTPVVSSEVAPAPVKGKVGMSASTLGIGIRTEVEYSSVPYEYL